MNYIVLAKVVKKLLLVIGTVVALGGCATTPEPTNPDILRSINYIGDDWYLAAMDTKSRVFVHARELPDRIVEHTHFRRGQNMMIHSTAIMKNWNIRFVNSGTDDVCAKVNFLEVDYGANIQDGWFILPTYSTTYIGELNQMPMFTVEQILAYDDAAWAVDTLKIIPYSKENGCEFPSNLP